MPITIQVFIPTNETVATLTAITGTGTADNPYEITRQGDSQFGIIQVDDLANLVGQWQYKVGTRAIGRVTIIAGETDYPISSGGGGGGGNFQIDSEQLATAVSSRLAVLAMRRLGDASRLVSDVTVTRGTTWRIPISSDDVAAGWTRIEFTARSSDRQSQADSLVHVVVSNPADDADGLRILGAETAVDASQGVITIVDDRPIATIDHEAVADVPTGEYCWDSKITTANGLDQISRGTLFVEPDVTRV